MSGFQLIRGLFLIILVTSITLYFLGFNVLVFILVAAVVYLFMLGLGSYYIRLNFFHKGIHRLSAKDKAIAITFDDGPHEVNTSKILDVLEKHDVKATFFMIGKNIVEFPDLTKTIINKGHQVGNHSFSHSNFFPFLSTTKIKEDFQTTNQLIEKFTGKANNLVRPPFGVTNPSIARAIKELKMKMIGWSIRSFDTSTREPQKVVARVIKQIKPGAIILLHDDRDNTPEILDAILLYTKENNYRHVLIH